MKHKYNKTKGFNEVYFVLYLTALILIIPDSDNNDADVQFNQLPTTFIKSEKSSLSIRLKSEKGKPNVVWADTVNYIYTLGDYQDIKFKVSISNNKIEKTIYQDGIDVNVPGFRVIEEGSGNLKFVWELDSIKLINKNYDVFVEAEIQQNNSDEKIYANTRFNLNLLIIDDYPINYTSTNINPSTNISDSSNELLKVDSNLSQIPATNPTLILNDISIVPDNPIMSLALTRWNTKVRIYGLNLITDLKFEPKISISNPSEFDNVDLRIENIGERFIEISGNTPPYDEIKISLTIVRKQDDLEARSEFIVKPIPLSSPDIPTIVYPFVTYRFNPKIPNSESEYFDAKIILNNETFASVTSNKIIEFTPIPEDVGKRLYFARYFKDVIVGSKIPIKISDFPKPEISTFKKESEKLRVFTKSYGYVAVGKNNYIDKLVLNDKSLKVNELTGFTETREDYIIQVFEIVGYTNQSINVFAVDLSGKKSEMRVYP
ncbi:hypothetical protein OAQ99_02995 [Candidatus Kapabacteria bacterium]|nr:hypothetical protein [Candidatus Kapabacteria bacterium]